VKPLTFLFSLLCFLASVGPAGADTPVSSWVPIEVPTDHERGSVELLESRGMPTVAWSNATVEVSAFDKVENRLISTLEATLTPQDPRWDPWLKELRPVFLPRDQVSRIWVPAGRQEEALGLLGVGATDTPVPGPRRITGWLVIFFSLFYLIFRSWAEVSGGRASPVRRRLWLPLGVLILAAGGWMTGGLSLPGPLVVAKTQASWLRHLWFQQAWPYGARWDDWAPGKAWTYPGYERRDGRIVESRSALAAADAAWARGSYDDLDPHGVARLFPRENP